MLNVFRSWWNRHSLHTYKGSVELPRLMPPGTSSSTMQTHTVGFGLCTVLEKVGDTHRREEGNFQSQQPTIPKEQGCHPHCLTGSRGIFGATLGLTVKRHLEELHVSAEGDGRLPAQWSAQQGCWGETAPSSQGHFHFNVIKIPGL